MDCAHNTNTERHAARYILLKPESSLPSQSEFLPQENRTRILWVFVRLFVYSGTAFILIVALLK